jgi:mRNA-degrading endonuclease RelE of RelBE toxin-antitoxin system
MKVEYLKQFSRDISKIKDQSLTDVVYEIILNIKQSDHINQIPNIKKIKGHSNAFRLRVGKYRLGFFYDGETIELSRFLKREDIYKLFP